MFCKSSQTHLALKQIPVPNITDAELYRNEAKRLNDIKDSKYMIKYYDDFIHSECRRFLTQYYFNIVTEFCSNGDLADVIYDKREANLSFSTTEKSKIVVQLVEAIKQLHSLNIAHRDIKSPNIFVTESNDFKLGDFGLSVVIRNKTRQRLGKVGTTSYMPPEMLLEMGGPTGKEGDIWCLGIVLLELETLKFSWEYEEDIGRSAIRYLKNPIEFIRRIDRYLPNWTDKSAKSLIKQLLHPVYTERPSILSIYKGSYYKKARATVRSEFKTPGSNKKHRKMRKESMVSTHASEKYSPD